MLTQNQKSYVSLYSDKSYVPKNNAQANLDGRTHWADDDTLRFFSCRILTAGDYGNGELFCVTYNQAQSFDGGKVFGFIIFDVFGECVIDRKFNSAHKRDKAYRITRAQCEAYVDLITETGLAHRVRCLQREIEALQS